MIKTRQMCVCVFTLCPSFNVVFLLAACVCSILCLNKNIKTSMKYYTHTHTHTQTNTHTQRHTQTHMLHFWGVNVGSASCGTQGYSLDHQLAELPGPWCVIGWQQLEGLIHVSSPCGPHTHTHRHTHTQRHTHTHHLDTTIKEIPQTLKAAHSNVIMSIN